MEAIAQQMILFGVAGAPVVFAAVYLLYRAFAFVVLEQLGRGPLNQAVGGAMKGIAFGRDGDHNPGNVSSRSHRFGTTPLILDGELAERMTEASEEAAQRLFRKYRSGAFNVDADQNEVLRKIAEDAMTWDALIHTTYFDHRELAEAIADHTTERLEGDEEADDNLIAPAKKHEGETWAATLARISRGWAVSLGGLAVGVAALLGAVAFLALKAVPMANNDHLADQRGFIPPPAPYVIGETFNDCDVCPELVVLPGGTFSMGSPSGEPKRNPNEGPIQRVTVQPFAAGQYEVTFSEWDACVADGGCNGYSPSDEDWGRSDRPVILVSWRDAQAYIAWLNSKVEGAPYRLLMEHEWEYAARAGTTTPYWWGEEASDEFANYGWKIGRTMPVGGYPANPFGLHDMHGNVYEWVQDCYRGNPGPSPDVSEGVGNTECPRALRGGSWSSGLLDLRSAYRYRDNSAARVVTLGFRIARTLEP
ncbi:formylglycine-generating enzyme family protein [Parvularcula sp. IMCC14364]|uniref:formylglycine-generating enzyme family protein n=1 Tax=Parvularcula sp. IMCC14364 TaxID=3067902 RepID=UPI0027425C1D|nr:formylglycine-generating enzyme family protein [Parvularcula sp. IMCC14364]